MLDLHRDSSLDLLRNRRIEIDFGFRSADRNNEAITRWQVIALLSRTSPPPTLGRVDSYETAGSKIGGRAFPNVLMQRTAMPLLISQTPIGIFRIDKVVIVFTFRSGVDARNEIGCSCIKRSLDIKSQSMRRVMKFGSSGNRVGKLGV